MSHILSIRAKIVPRSEAPENIGHGECVCGHEVQMALVPVVINGVEYTPRVDLTVLTELFQHGRN